MNLRGDQPLTPNYEETAERINGKFQKGMKRIPGSGRQPGKEGVNETPEAFETRKKLYYKVDEWLRHVYYRSDTKIEVMPEDHEYLPYLSLKISRRSHPNSKYVFANFFDIPRDIVTEAQFVHWLRQCIHAFEIGVSDKILIYKGAAPFANNNG